MQLDQNPFFRKVITPWYDSNIACWMLVGWAFLVMLFGIIGISVVFSRTLYANFLWFPCILASLNCFLGVKVLIRLTSRYRNS